MSTQLNIDALIDVEYQRDLDDLRRDFLSQVDVLDKTSLNTWITAHPYLSVHDLARIAGVCHRTVYRWRKRAGWAQPIWSTRTHIKPTPPRPPVRRSDIPTAPADWDTAWLIKMYNDKWSVKQLAKATKRTPRAIKKRLLPHLKLRNYLDCVRSQHPCFNLAWVFEHYVRLKLSQQQCARRAGVSRYTFSVWLDQLKIRVRSATEQALIANGTDLGKCPQTKTM